VSYVSGERCEETATRSQTHPLSMPVPFRVSRFYQTKSGVSKNFFSWNIPLTFWQTRHSGRPRASSHSPGPNGKLTSPSAATLVTTPSKPFPPRPLSRQLIITSSILALQSSSRETSKVRRSLIQFRNSLNQNHGVDQSSRTTMSVLGIVWGVKSGFKRGVNDGEGSARRYIERRASISSRVSISHEPS